MSDLDSYVTHCYDLILKAVPMQHPREDAELCACATLVKHAGDDASKI